MKAIDFIQKFIDKNKEINGHLNNIVFQQADVTELVIPGNRCAPKRKERGGIEEGWRRKRDSKRDIRETPPVTSKTEKN